ncbi:AimR family lysis-lysogeny pheromone receptor [Halobacillus sp. HZG1]|uniref:AimR family lysis-lysogeny pheromone receptor n=1 Tax=Halobacillus sp. HZG1 TaxID=3111769 RepID=UPI002DBFC8A5|nr:AimR family lysis-lysogeny pheromone receptor [Halobacillus sp. HZG1]MEC3883661.1 AimR family lysis-lysogeny pheromone receptor [Halobacillus sp. HZG1]
MPEYQLIEPSPLRKLQMGRASSLYDVYLDYLRKYPRRDAVLKTKDYILSHFPSAIDEQIVCMEFFYMNDFFEELSVITDSPYINKEAGHLYRVILSQNERDNNKNYLDELKDLQFTHPSLRCLHLFTLVYSYQDLKVFTALDKYLDECDQTLQQVDEPLMYYYLNQRYQELLFYHYWKTNNSILASRYAYKMINTEVSSRRKSRMHHDLALCQLFNGYESSMESLQKSMEIAEKDGHFRFLQMVKNHSLPFISSFHQRTEGITSTDPVEQAHLALARGDYKKTQEILDSFSSLTPFQESYLGLATGDREMLRNSYHRFIQEQGDYFFAQLPLAYLERI